MSGCPCFLPPFERERENSILDIIAPTDLPMSTLREYRASRSKTDLTCKDQNGAIAPIAFQPRASRGPKTHVVKRPRGFNPRLLSVVRCSDPLTTARIAGGGKWDSNHEAVSHNCLARGPVQPSCTPIFCNSGVEVGSNHDVTAPQRFSRPPLSPLTIPPKKCPYCKKKRSVVKKDGAQG